MLDPLFAAVAKQVDLAATNAANAAAALHTFDFGIAQIVDKVHIIE